MIHEWGVDSSFRQSILGVVRRCPQGLERPARLDGGIAGQRIGAAAAVVLAEHCGECFVRVWEQARLRSTACPRLTSILGF